MHIKNFKKLPALGDGLTSEHLKYYVIRFHLVLKVHFLRQKYILYFENTTFRRTNISKVKNFERP